MDKQDFYNNYNEITKEALLSSKLPFLKETLEKTIDDIQDVYNSLNETIKSFFADKTDALHNPVSQFNEVYKNRINYLIENFKKIETLFAESKQIIAELENYPIEKRDFLPALEKQVLEFAFNNFINYMIRFTNYLTNYKEWLEDTNNLPTEIKAKIKKENSALNAAKHNDIMKQRLLMMRQNQLKKQNKK